MVNCLKLVTGRMPGTPHAHHHAIEAQISFTSKKNWAITRSERFINFCKFQIDCCGLVVWIFIPGAPLIYQLRKYQKVGHGAHMDQISDAQKNFHSSPRRPAQSGDLSAPSGPASTPVSGDAASRRPLPRRRRCHAVVRRKP